MNSVSKPSCCTMLAFNRIFQDDTPDDKAAIQPLLNLVVVYPLSQFDGKMKTKDWKNTPSFPAQGAKGGK